MAETKPLREAAPSASSNVSSRLPISKIFAAAVIVALAAVPVLAAVFDASFYVTLISRMMIFGLAALGLSLILGYGAMVSFGHAMYIGVGAYAVGIMSFHGITNGYAHLAAGLVVGTLLAIPVGLVCLRVSGIAFIMITLAFAQMLYFLAISLRQYGGDDGYGLQARSNFGVINIENNVVLYYLTFAVLMVTFYAFYRLVNSRFGMVLRGSKSNERRMKALGFPTLRFKLIAYVISALVCVLAGVLLANLARFVSPSYMTWLVSGDIMLMIVLGGVGTLMGPIVGAMVWLTLEEMLSSFHLGLPAVIEEFVRAHWMLMLGTFIVIVALTLKQGLYGYLVEREQTEKS